MRIIVAIAIMAVVSGCASPSPSVYYSSYPDYSPYSPYPDQPAPSPELYGDPDPYAYAYPYAYPQAYGYGGPYGYTGYWAKSSSVCLDSGRLIPCPGTSP